MAGSLPDNRLFGLLGWLLGEGMLFFWDMLCQKWVAMSKLLQPTTKITHCGTVDLFPFTNFFPPLEKLPTSSPGNAPDTEKTPFPRLPLCERLHQGAASSLGKPSGFRPKVVPVFLVFTKGGRFSFQSTKEKRKQILNVYKYTHYM